MLLAENSGIAWEGSGGTGRGSSRTPPPPQTPHQKDIYLQPVGPCRATVALEAWLSLEREKRQGGITGEGTPCAFTSSPP